MDKNKISENAAKFAAKGAWDKAIKEYELLLKLDTRDVRVLQKLGELQQKKGDNAAAANYFVKVAESFAGDGFFLKAVAQYKQALKLNPGQVELNLKLAELHQRLQLVGEAMAYLQVLANHYDQAGDVDRLLEILTKMVDLEPENAGSRVKLGDLFAREQKLDRAMLEYRRAADQYKRGNRMDDFVRVGERLLALEPNDGALGKELARLYVQRAEHTRALGRIQPLFKADPRDPEVLELLAEAFEGLGQTAKAASTWKELARVQLAKGNADEAERAWGAVARLNPADGDVAARNAATAAAAARQVVSPPAAPPGADPAPAATVAPPPRPPPPAASAAPPRPPPPPAPAPPPAPTTLLQLLAEADVLLSQGQLQGAMERLYAVLAQEPENLDAHERAYNVYASAGDGASAFEQLLNVLRLCTRASDIARGQPYLDVLLAHSPSHPEVPAFVAVLRPALAQAAGPTAAELQAAAAAQAAAERAEAERLAAERAAAEAAARAEAERLAAERAAAEAAARAEAERLAAERAAAEAAARAEAERAAAAAAARAEAERVAAERAVAERRAEAERVEAERAAAERGATAAPSGPPPAYLNARCEQARVLFAEGRFLEGRMVLREVFAADGAHPWAVSLRSWADQVSPETGETGRQSGTSSEGVADIAADISAELHGAPLVVAPEVEQVTAEQVFSEFKKGLARVVKPEDVETHYDLGIAYKEMGLLEDAASEFEIARQGCAGKRKEVDCLAMAALVHAATGRYDAAVGAYVQALRSSHASGEVKKALLYDLAATREQMGSPGRALTHFLAVQGLDGAYRDVAKVVSRLKVSVQPEADDLDAGSGAAGRYGP